MSYLLPPVLVFRHGGNLLLRQFHALGESQIVRQPVKIAGSLRGLDVDLVKEQCPPGEIQGCPHRLPVPISHISLDHDESPALVQVAENAPTKPYVAEQGAVD